MYKAACFVLCSVLLLVHAHIQVIQTAYNTDDRLTPKQPLQFTTGSPGSSYITVDASKQYQKIIGFGGAFTEAMSVAVHNSKTKSLTNEFLTLLKLSGLNEDLQNEIYEAYFGKNGINYTLCRTHINSCDYCEKSYSYDDVADDFNLTHFSIAHDEKTLIPMILKAYKTAENAGRKRFKLFASPWSPPAWMKFSDTMIGSLIPGLGLEEKYHRVWAEYLSRYMTEYKKRGVDMWAMTVQNEPLNLFINWEACFYWAEEERDFVSKYLGPTMERDHPELKIIIFDHNKDNIVWYVSDILKHQDAAKYISGSGFHWYAGAHFDHLDQVHEAFPDKFLLSTEACAGPGVLLGAWDRGERYGRAIIGDLNHWSAGWVDWNMVLQVKNCTSTTKFCISGPNHADPQGDDSPIAADTVLQKVHYQIPYFYIGHFSKFIQPDSVRISVSMTVVGVNATAFLTPKNDIVLVVMNTSDKPVEFDIAYKNQKASVTSPQHAIQTFIWKQDCP